MLVLAAVSMLPATAFAGAKVYEKDDFTLELGMRIQARMEYSRIPAVAGGTEWLRDYMIRRARLKANGKIQGCTYGLEWKIDGTDQNGATPAAAVENEIGRASCRERVSYHV